MADYQWIMTLRDAQKKPAVNASRKEQIETRLENNKKLEATYVVFIDKVREYHERTSDPRAATLEITVLGPELAFESDALVALCGAEMEAVAGGRPLPGNRPVFIEKGTVLHARRTHLGSRAYLAVAGGIGVQPVLGSRSTYLPAKFGGLEGRALKAGDILPLASDAAALANRRYEKLSRREDKNGIRTVAWSTPSLTLPERERASYAKRLRFRFIAVAATLGRSGRRLVLRLASGYPLLADFIRARARIRGLARAPA